MRLDDPGLTSTDDHRGPRGAHPGDAAAAMSEDAPGAASSERRCKVEVQDPLRDKRLLGSVVVASLVGTFAAPWGLAALGMETASLFAALIGLGSYFASALSFAGADRGPGERRLRDGSVTIEGERLLIAEGAKESSLPLARLAGGWTERTPNGHAAVLSFSDGRVAAVEQASEEEAIDLLSRAGAGAQARAVRMRTYREDSGGRKIAGCLLAFFVLILAPGALALLILLFTAIAKWSIAPLVPMVAMGGLAPLLGVAAWLWSKVTPSWVHIGTDGVMVKSAFRRRFLPHRAIVQVTLTHGGVGGAYHFVKIGLRHGESITVPAASPAEATALIERIQAAQAAVAMQDRARLLEVIARNGRPLAEWKKALGSLVARTGYRTAGNDLEEVLRIVEDGSAPPEQRVAAALAARPHGGEAAEKRIRVAAEASAEPKLRLALEKVSAGEDEDDLLEEIGAGDARKAAG
ncbi:hypothetical protein WME77_42325 [Sorangium sp. So ce764]|uniref:hypothetical protein n=1 Tax=Sorangium sp. So ce764 TaxID=3133320 RepID=UPI003F606A57